MKAMVHDRYGSPEVLELRDIPVPHPGEGEVLVEVGAAGVDRGTHHLMTGLPYLLRLFGYGLTAPRQRTPGRDFAGRVIKLGPGVSDFAVDDQVFGICAGAFAEYAVCSTKLIARKPASLSFVEAAALPTSAVTALLALRDAGKLRANQRVLILGSAGGVGSFTVQIAKLMRARPTGVCSSRGLELSRSLGADRVIDYTENDLSAERDYDLVIDIGGDRSLSRLRRLLTPQGTLVIVGSEKGGRLTGGVGRSFRAALLSPWVKHKLVALMFTENAESLRSVAELVDAGELSPVIERSYPLREAAEAIRQIGRGGTLGKLVVTVAPSDRPA
ncbi:NAD(P)-dependent alcohol dehydrogenase [Psychromicrobium sp. YIM B11713]|uniref:NAD(P)-dependent alcohol dehydrogenase n=1 Tax=Psychromicrobium sp. YIM B11713 TaxID=3145233 RepID=UPI00374E5B61